MMFMTLGMCFQVYGFECQTSQAMRDEKCPDDRTENQQQKTTPPRDPLFSTVSRKARVVVALLEIFDN